MLNQTDTAPQSQTPEALAAKVGAYFSECEALDVFPDRANMIIYLGMPYDTFCCLENTEEPGNAPFAAVIQDAKLRREGWLSRAMFSDKTKAQSAMFQLRQPLNGGYSDKQEDSGAVAYRMLIGKGDKALLD